MSRERERPAGHFSATRSSCFESIDCDIFRRNASERQRVSDRCHSVVFSFFRPKRRNCFVDWCNPTQVKIPFQFLNRSNCVSPSQVDTFVFCFYSSGHAEREIRSFPMSRPPKATTFRNTTLSGLVKCQHCDTFNVEINPTDVRHLGRRGFTIKASKYAQSYGQFSWQFSGKTKFCTWQNMAIKF